MASSSRPIEERQKRTYWYRCSRLLIEGSLTILKEVLENHCRGQLDGFLKFNENNLQWLVNEGILHYHQRNLLNPPANLDSLDITLITCILLNCQPQLQPAQNKSLNDIRQLRNRYFAHISSLSLEENEFINNWRLITNCLSNAENVLGVNKCLHKLVDEVRAEELGNVERFREELIAWKSSDDKILSALEEILKKQAKCSRKLDDVAENVEEIKARLPKRLKKEGDDVKKEVTDGVWKELQQCLMNDYKKFLIKAPITANESLSYETDIDDIYAEPKLLLVDHTAQTKETCNKNQKPITPKDIFPSDRNKCSNIYVTGDAGMGKTSLCKYILSAWCKAHQKGETEKSDFVLALEQYDFAFYISLRHAKRQDYMIDMLVSQRLQHIVLNNPKLRGFQPKFLLDEVLRLNSEKCLIILDGWDEWQLSENVPSENDGIPLRDPHLNYTILTTTRPWKLEQLRLKESRIDKQVKITGVENTKMFAEKLILCNNKREKRKETYDSFNQCLLDNGLTELRETPILLKHLVCLWFQNQSLGKSKTEIYTNMIELWLQNAERRKGGQHLFSTKKGIDHNIKIPNVFQKRNKCARYTDLLKEVGKLAYVTATQEEVIQLAFESTDEYEISEYQIKHCLDIGILTQSIVPDMTCERKSISFPHKIFHEFFAALYMGWHCSEHGVITCKTIKGLIESERENMCIFLSAIWPSVFESLIEVFYTNKSKDKKEVVYKKKEDKYIQDLLLNCCCESIAANNYCPKVDFKFMSLHGPDFEENDSGGKMLVVLSKMFNTEILRPNMIGVFVDLSSVTFLQQLNIYRSEFESLVVSSSLRSLNLFNVNIVTPEGIDGLMSSIAKAKKLKRLQIFDFNEDRKLIVTLDLSNNKNLSTLFLNTMHANKLSLSLNITELTLCNFHLASHEEIVSTMKKMSTLTRLRSVKLFSVYCSEHRSHKKCFLDVDLSKTSFITLQKVSFSMLRVSPTTGNTTIVDVYLASHKDLISLLMKHATNLNKHDFLISVYCCEHKQGLHFFRGIDASTLMTLKPHSQCLLDVDLSQNTLMMIYFQGVSFSMLSVSPNLEDLTFHDIQLASHEDIVSLMTNVANLTNLTVLSLKNVYCSEHKSHSQCFLDVDLSQNITLRNIKFQEISFSKLSVSPNLEDLTFHDIQLASHEDIVSLMTNVANLTNLTVLSLKNVYCSEHKSHSQCFLDVDLSQNITLRNIKFQEISFSKLSVSPDKKYLTFPDIQLASHDEVVSLMKNITNLTTPQYLSVSKVYCSEHKSQSRCFLDVDFSQSTFPIKYFKDLSLSMPVLRHSTPTVFRRMVQNIQLASNEEVAFFLSEKRKTNSSSLTDAAANAAAYAVAAADADDDDDDDFSFNYDDNFVGGNDRFNVHDDYDDDDDDDDDDDENDEKDSGKGKKRDKN